MLILEKWNDEVLVILNLSDAQHLKVQILDEMVKENSKSIFSGLTTDFDAKPTIEMYKWGTYCFLRNKICQMSEDGCLMIIKY